MEEKAGLDAALLEAESRYEVLAQELNSLEERKAGIEAMVREKEAAAAAAQQEAERLGQCLQ